MNANNIIRAPGPQMTPELWAILKQMTGSVSDPPDITVEVNGHTYPGAVLHLEPTTTPVHRRPENEWLGDPPDAYLTRHSWQVEFRTDRPVDLERGFMRATVRSRGHAVAGECVGRVDRAPYGNSILASVILTGAGPLEVVDGG